MAGSKRARRSAWRGAYGPWRNKPKTWEEGGGDGELTKAKDNGAEQMTMVLHSVSDDDSAVLGCGVRLQVLR